MNTTFPIYAATYVFGLTAVVVLSAYNRWFTPFALLAFMLAIGWELGLY